MVGHEDGPAAVAAGDHYEEIALVSRAVLVALPAVHPGVGEVRSPPEGQFADKCLAAEAVGRDLVGVEVEQVIAERLQVAVVVA
jgi:hypothetical protein